MWWPQKPLTTKRRRLCARDPEWRQQLASTYRRQLKSSIHHWRRHISGGRAAALALAAQGCDVAVNYSRSQQAAEQTAADVQALGVNAIALQGDVAEDVDCSRMVAQTIDAFGRLDGLVN
ncbi:MAG: SDR family NAD(P)-dependent oxidoreductase, partial [Acidimicrobiales bacterium]